MPLTIDSLAQEIRRVDGNHSLGAGALADALMPFLLNVVEAEKSAVRPLPAVGEEAEKYREARGVAWRSVFDTLRDYRMGNMIYEEGDGYCLVDRLSRDGDGVSIADGEMEMVSIADEIMIALEKVAEEPVGYLKPDGQWTQPPRYIPAEERKDEWAKQVFTIPVYGASSNLDERAAGSTMVKRLEWNEVPDTAGMWWEADTGFGVYRCESVNGSRWRVWSDAVKKDLPSLFDDLDAAQAAAQSDFEKKVLSLLSEVPLGGRQAHVVKVAQLRWKDSDAIFKEEGPIYSEAEGAGYIYVAEAIDATLQEEKRKAQRRFERNVLASLVSYPLATSVLDDLEDVRKAVFGDVGDEPDVYADYDRLSELSGKMRKAISNLADGVMATELPAPETVEED